MIYKFVFIALLATNARSQDYKGWPNGQYNNSYVQPDQWNLHDQGKNYKLGHIRRVREDAQMYNETHNPCTMELPSKPSFKRPGRRISEEKCLEFIWDIKANDDNRQKDRKCKIYLHGNQEGFIGGRHAMKGEFPHMGALGWKGRIRDYIFKCGGTIISAKFMITAAHCTISARDERISNPEPQIVRIGSKDIQSVYENISNKITHIQYMYIEGAQDIKIAKIIRHPSYQSPKNYFDIALLELERSVIFDTNVQAACLWNNLNTDKIEKVSAAGWGVTRKGSYETTRELRAGDLDLINNDICNQLLLPKSNRNWRGLEEHQICAGKLSGGVDTCQGDSGGPLQVKINLPKSIGQEIYYLLGVTSFGFGCANSNSPGVYTRISSFTDWIEQNVWPNEVTSGN